MSPRAADVDATLAPIDEAADGRRSGSIQVLSRADAILDAVARSPTTSSGAELARQVGLNKSTVFNILSTLVDLGFLTITPESRHYQLGPRMFQLANAFQSSFQLISIAGPYLYGLRDQTGETVSMHVRSGWDRVCIEQAPSQQSITRVIELGRRRPLYSGAAGLVLMSGLDDLRIESYLTKTKLAPLTAKTVTDPAKLWRSIAQTRKRGYAEAYEESEVGVTALAVPIRDPRSVVDAAMVVSGPSSRYNRAAVARTLPAAQAVANEISRERGAFEVPLADV
jgi:IclR family transcriptional regulator, acetate operon repressor